MVDQVPLLDLKRQNKACEAELRAAFERVLASGHFIMGPEVESFEKECALLLGAKHAIGVSSGTDALLLALMALGIGPGDDVIVPSYSFFATAGCVVRAGARPVFADVLPCCFNLDPRSVARVATKKTKAVMPVHLFGQCAQMEPLLEMARERDWRVVEDAAQSFSARYKGRSAGTLGDFGCFSFFPSKNLGAFGDAGLVTTEDDGLADRARMLRVHGMKPKYYHHMVGGNFRLDALQAALLRVKLPRLAGYTEARRRNVRFYREALASLPVTLPTVCEPEPIWNQLVIRVPGKRDQLMEHLKKEQVGTEIYYPLALHRQKCFEEIAPEEGSLPESERASKETLALPVFPELTTAELEHVANAIARFFR
jgi:dTDP-4-amino-4,6-dideoxygalactose transaminase